MIFDDFDLDPDLLDGLDAMGFRNPTPIQEQAIPVILEGRDLIACAQTGTGKTAAFVLPVIDRILASPKRHLNALILTPTRELAQQIDQQVEGLSYYTSVNSIPIYGGGDGALWDQQHKALKKGADMIIATPGRLISFLNTGNFDFSSLRHLILDEADRMLDMGFFDDIMRIVSMMPKQRQTLLFSATMPPKIRTLAQKILKNPAEINIAISKPPERIKQHKFVIYEPQKNPLVKSLLKGSPFRSILIFCSKKINVKQLTRDLKKAGFNAEEIHSDLDQSQREETLRQFASKQLPILVATDILSRGIDIDQIELVINYDVPHDGEDYVHRIGRTARAETDGTAYTFVTDKELRRMAQIEKLIGRQIPRATIPPELGPTPGHGPAPASDRPTGGGPRHGGQRRHGPPSGGRGGRPGGGHGGGPKGRPSKGGSGPRQGSPR